MGSVGRKNISTPDLYSSAEVLASETTSQSKLREYSSISAAMSGADYGEVISVSATRKVGGMEQVFGGAYVKVLTNGSAMFRDTRTGKVYSSFEFERMYPTRDIDYVEVRRK